MNSHAFNKALFTFIEDNCKTYLIFNIICDSIYCIEFVFFFVLLEMFKLNNIEKFFSLLYYCIYIYYQKKKKFTKKDFLSLSKINHIKSLYDLY